MDPKITQSHVESWLPNLMYHSGPEGSTIVHEYRNFYFSMFAFQMKTPSGVVKSTGKLKYYLVFEDFFCNFSAGLKVSAIFTTGLYYIFI